MVQNLESSMDIKSSNSLAPYIMLYSLVNERERPLPALPRPENRFLDFCGGPTNRAIFKVPKRTPSAAVAVLTLK
ncbi:unnamed protein product [Brugia timori]|uniref:Ovule protein n=1 Tax=Brugia timori TaxID=42155 RepID=A0A0R3QH34_9BILA|nr:unnamed protein product [Brugia timori]